MAKKPTVRSLNQLVAYNLQRARQLRGMTQSGFGDEMARVTGRPWSNATVSAAERSWDGKRVRQFDANELVAMANILDVPLAFFFLMPREGTPYEFTACDVESGGAVVKMLPMMVLDAIAPESAPAEFAFWLAEDLVEFAGRPPSSPMPLPLDEWAARLRQLADELDQVRGNA